MKLEPWEPDLRSLVDRINKDDIDLQPDFQRQEVWSPAKKKKLVDTILRGWSIPPIHLVVVDDDRLVVLDGQQRLASIRDFFNNKLSIDGYISPFDEDISQLDGILFRDLSASRRRRIEQYALRCFRITDYSAEEPSELFYRLNQPSMLTAGEQRNALFGPARQQLKELVAHFTDTGNNQHSIGFSNSRLAYDDIFARLMYFVELGSFGEKGTETRISDRFRLQQPFNLGVIGRCEAAINSFTNCLNLSGTFKLNKASTLSWLLFFSRFGWYPAEPNIFHVYKLAEAHTFGDESALSHAAALFRDRASLRVTDVSSVILRDVCICVMHELAGPGIQIPHVDKSQLRNLIEFVETQMVPLEFAIEETVDLSRWSHSL